jgi:hypothetical protein
VARLEKPDLAEGVSAVEGRIYVAGYDSGLSIIDISNPRSPRLCATIDTPGYAMGVSTPERASRSGRIPTLHAFVADFDGGFQVVDVTDPRHATIVGHCALADLAVDLVAVEGRAFVALGEGGLQIIDISNPGSPVVISHLDTPGFASDVAMSGGRALVADGSALIIIAVSNGHRPKVIESLPLDAVSVTLAGSSAFVGTRDRRLVVLDVSDSSPATIVGSVSLPDYPRKVVELAHNFALVASGLGGGVIVNISNRDAPTVVGLIQATQAAWDVTTTGGTICIAGPKGIELFEIEVTRDLDGLNLHQSLDRPENSLTSSDSRG